MWGEGRVNIRREKYEWHVKPARSTDCLLIDKRQNCDITSVQQYGNQGIKPDILFHSNSYHWEPYL